ncbi:MAG: tRNA lysidine(34) synthetase TilS [Phycisphaeraceae bacterium]
MPDAAYHPLMRRVTTALRRRCGVGEGDRLLVAVSGGADSVALFRALQLLAPRRRWRLDLHVAHVHHGLRTPDADRDAAFVQALADRFGVPLHRRDVRLHDPKRNVEAQARDLRYRALREVAEAERCTRVATAHHSDDQLETLLLAMVRGKSLRRMRGIAWQRPLEPGSPIRLIRPMLGVTREEAVDFLHTLEQGWREDRSNTDPARARNRLRRDVVPVLRELNPEVARAAAELTDRLRHQLRDNP